MEKILLCCISLCGSFLVTESLSILNITIFCRSAIQHPKESPSILRHVRHTGEREGEEKELTLDQYVRAECCAVGRSAAVTGVRPRSSAASAGRLTTWTATRTDSHWNQGTWQQLSVSRIGTLIRAGWSRAVWPNSYISGLGTSVKEGKKKGKIIEWKKDWCTSLCWEACTNTPTHINSTCIYRYSWAWNHESHLERLLQNSIRHTER